MWIGAGDCRAPGNVWDVVRRALAGRGGFFGLLGKRQPAVLVALWQNLDREVRAVALAQTAADAVGGFDDRVVSQDEAVLGADLDTDVAALAPLVDPSDVDVVDDGGGAVRSSFGGVRSGRGDSPESVDWPTGASAYEVYGIERADAEAGQFDPWDAPGEAPGY